MEMKIQEELKSIIIECKLFNHFDLNIYYQILSTPKIKFLSSYSLIALAFK